MTVAARSGTEDGALGYERKRPPLALPSPMRPIPSRIALITCALALGACGEEAGSLTDPGLEAPVDRLLTDEELRTPDDPAAPTENPQWSSWVADNHEPIRSLTHDDYSDLDFLREFVANRRVVQLGESGHGVREFSQLKVRLVKYLHEQLGFDVIAFESSLFECFMADAAIGLDAPLQVLDSCVFPVWRTEEVLELFDYLERTRATSRPLRLAGFDTQISSRLMSLRRPEFLGDMVRPLDPAYGDYVQAIDIEFLDNYQRALAGRNFYVVGNRDRFVAEYDSLASYLVANRTELATLADGGDRDVGVAIQTARSMVAFVEQLAGEGFGAIEARDDGMAANLRFLLDELYPSGRVIVWAHNFHVRHANEEVEPAPQPRTMGAEIDALLGDDLYSIGLYMYTGVAATNDGLPYEVAPATSGSLASILYRARRRWSFVDLTNPDLGVGSDWMSVPVVAKTWGVNPLTMIVRRQYDGLMFVHTVSRPAYLPRLTG